MDRPVIGGQNFERHDDPVASCSRIQRDLEAIETADELTMFWGRNSVAIEMLRHGVPALKTEKGEHYSDILEGLFLDRIKVDPIVEAERLWQATRDGKGEARSSKGATAP